MIAVYINNMQKLVNKKSTILQACKTVGVQIPRFCYHEQLSIAGNCRMCLVEVSTAIKPVASCALQVVEGQKIFTNTKLVTKAREGVLEFLLANHPLDCPICDQGGECDLQDQALLFGKDRGRFYEFKRAVSDKNCGPLIKTIMTRCIHCTRCVRFLSELAGTVELGTTGRGVKTEIGNYITKSIISEVSGNIIDLCPVGALTSKPYAFTTRSWELMKTETIDTFDSMCSNIVVHSYGQRLMRVLPILNESVNQEWINDKTRFGYDILFKKRLFYSYVILEKSKGLTRVSWLFVYKSLLILYNLFTNRRNLALIGNDISLETGFILKYNSNLSLIQHQIFDKHFFIHSIDFKSSYLFLGGYLSFSKADCIVLCGVNLRVEMPLLLIRLRKSIYQYRLKVALFGRLDNYFLKLAHLGNTILSFFFFLRGRHRFCSVFKQGKNPLLLLGATLLQNINLNFFLVNLVRLPNLVQRNRNGLKILANGAGMAGVHELGSTTSILSLKWRCKEFNLFDTILRLHSHTHKLLDEKISLNIYQATHGISPIMGNTIMLPSVSSLETNAYYLNNLGMLQSSKFIFNPPEQSRVDWKILLNLSNYIQQNVFSLERKVVLKRIMRLCNIRTNTLGYLTFSMISESMPSKVYKGLLTPSHVNFYTNDALSVTSRVLEECSKIVQTRKILNFEIL